MRCGSLEESSYDYRPCYKKTNTDDKMNTAAMHPASFLGLSTTRLVPWDCIPVCTDPESETLTHGCPCGLLSRGCGILKGSLTGQLGWYIKFLRSEVPLAIL